MTLIEAAKLALDALEPRPGMPCPEYESLTQCAITAIREALAQPEQETQAYREAARLAEWLFKTHYAQEEHYASGRVVWGLCDTTAGVISQIDNMVCKLVLPKEPEQEPYCWTWDEFVSGGKWRAEYGWKKPTGKVTNLQPLYTTPPQRTWVGLTPEDYNGIFQQARTGEHAVQLAEAKLKEKNT